ncbi:hypothetical protein OSH12_25985, partial [Kaistia terrae]
LLYRTSRSGSYDRDKLVSPRIDRDVFEHSKPTIQAAPATLDIVLAPRDLVLHHLSKPEMPAVRGIRRKATLPDSAP